MSEQNIQENFKLVSPYKPTGDQPEAIAKLVDGVERGDKEQTLLGVTGSGKTFTIANVIAQDTDFGTGTQQDACCAMTRVSGVFS